MDDPPAPPRGRSRRWVLASGLALLAGGGAGAAAEFLLHRRAAQPAVPVPPAALVAAVAAERRLVADLDATTGGTSPVRSMIRQTRADHAAHLAALVQLLATYDRRSASTGTNVASASPHPPASALPRGAARTRAQLRAAEQRAAAAAGRWAMELNGAQAALLASIAACEATHAELLG